MVGGGWRASARRWSSPSAGCRSRCWRPPRRWVGASARGRTPCPDGTEQVVEHGFHAFFRHYYTWRAVLRRIDPGLAFLRPVGGYPVISRSWPPEDLTGLPAAPPLNLIALFARSPSLGLRDLLGSDQALAVQLLAYDPRPHHRRPSTGAGRRVPAALGMSDRAQAMLLRPSRGRSSGTRRSSGRGAGRDVPLLLPGQPRGHRVRRPRHRLPDQHLDPSPAYLESTAPRCAPAPPPARSPRPTRHPLAGRARWGPPL